MSFGGSDSSTGSTGQSGSTSANQASYSTNGNGSTTAANAGQLQDFLNQAQQTYQQGGYTAGGQEVGKGVSSVNSGATAASGINGAGNTEVADTLNGTYLNGGNPEYQNMVTQMGESIKPQVDSGFEASGRYGSGAQANAFDSAIANEAGQLGYQNYAAERGNQVATAASLPSYTAGLTQPGQAQIAAGGAQTASDYTPMQQYLSALQGVSPGQSTTNNSTSTMLQNGEQNGSSVSQSNNDSNHVASK